MSVFQAYRFCLDPTPAQERRLASHVGAARVAYNWGLGQVKAALNARGWERRLLGAPISDAPWTLAALRREWNQAKTQVAPWWAENSKEAYSSGLSALANGLRAWSESRHGKRAGRPIGFPRRRRRSRCRESFSYTTGNFGVSGRNRVKLPRIGHVRTHEATTKLVRKLEYGSARILRATISRDGGRWFCSFTCIVERSDPLPVQVDAIAGVDVGVRNLAVVSTGEIVPNPRALERVQRKLRRLHRKVDRQRRAGNPDCYDKRGQFLRGRRATRRSNRQRRTERQIARLYARARNARRDALNKLTTELASTYGTVVVERLNIAGMLRNRRIARSLHDASLAEIRRQLTYKCAWRGGMLVEAPVFFPSSKTCSECRHVKAKLPPSERIFHCERCGLRLDRDLNAARNLAALGAQVAASGAETKNARSPTPVSPGMVGHGVDREAGGVTLAHQTGAAGEQSKAA